MTGGRTGRLGNQGRREEVRWTRLRSNKRAQSGDRHVSRELSDESSGRCASVCLVKGGKQGTQNCRPSPSLASFSPFFSLSTALWSSRPSHAQPILSFPRTSLSSQVTEAFHRTFRRVWPRFQPKFHPRCGHRSRQEGEECRKDPHPHPERCQGQGTRSCRQRRRGRHPRRQLFPSQPRPTRLRTGKSVRFRTGSVPSSPLFSRYLSSIIIVIALCRSAGRDLPQFWGSSMLCPGVAPPSRVAGVPSSGLVLSSQPNRGYPC